MRAFVITAPRVAEIQDVADPVPGPEQVVIDVERVGVCGTDAELFTGEMAYVQTGEVTYPMRIGHEFCGIVSEVGKGVDAALAGRRVIGDVMVGCGSCRRCSTGRQHLCAQRAEMGVRDGWAGALAERMLLPLAAVHELPPSVDATAGAFVEPAGNAYRAVDACALGPGDSVLIIGPGTIGLLAGLIARAIGLEVHLLGVTQESLTFARSLGFDCAWDSATLPSRTWDAVIDATNDPAIPARALDLVDPGRRLICIGLAGEPTSVDSRKVALNEVTVVGLLGAAPGLDPAIDLLASGAVDPSQLLAATVGLKDAAFVLAGGRRDDWTNGPKIHIDPRGAH